MIWYFKQKTILFKKEDLMKKIWKIMVLSIAFSLCTVLSAYAQDFSIVSPSYVGLDSSLKKGDYLFEIWHDGDPHLTVQKGNKIHISLPNIEENVLTNNNRMYYMKINKDVLTMYRMNLKDKKTTKISSIKIPNLDLTRMKHFAGSDLYISISYNSEDGNFLSDSLYKFDFTKKKFVKLLSKADSPVFSSHKIFHWDFDSKTLYFSDLNGKENKLFEKSVIYHKVLNNTLYYVTQDQENNCYIYTATAKGTNKQKIFGSFQADSIWDLTQNFVYFIVHDEENTEHLYKMNLKTGEMEERFEEYPTIE